MFFIIYLYCFTTYAFYTFLNWDQGVRSSNDIRALPILVNLMKYTQAHVYILSLFSLVICKKNPWIGADSLLTLFSSHDPRD